MWGKADDGQLGLGGIEDTFIPVARSEDTVVCPVYNGTLMQTSLVPPYLF